MEKKKILIVDDDRKILELLDFKFSLQGYEVTTALDEKSFFKKATEIKPDLIILDIWLKSKLGTELYDSLLNFGFDQDVPVIFITALIENDPPRCAPEGGRYALFAKPFDFEQLLAEVRRLLLAREAQAEKTVHERRAV